MKWMLPFAFLLMVTTIAWTQPLAGSDSSASSQYPYVTVQAGLLVPNPDPVPGADITSLGLPIHLKLTSSVGLIKNPHFGMGIGSGLMILDRGMVIPAFLEFRGDFLKKDVTPFYYAQAGTGLPVYAVEEQTDWWGNPVFEDFSAKPGYLIDVGLGLKVRNNERSATTLSIGFQSMSLTENYSAWGSRFRNEYSFQRLSIQGGWVF